MILLYSPIPSSSLTVNRVQFKFSIQRRDYSLPGIKWCYPLKWCQVETLLFVTDKRHGWKRSISILSITICIWSHLSPPLFTPPQPRCLHIPDSRPSCVLNRLKGSALACPLYSITCNSIQKHSLGTTFTWALHSQNCGAIQPRMIVLQEWKDGVFQSMCHRIINNSSVFAERAALLLTWATTV